MTPFRMKRRRLLLGAGAAACGLLAACDFSLRDGVFNACLAELPSDLREHPLVTGAWDGLDAGKVCDTHCHVFGDGDSGSALWFNPRMEQIWNPRGYVQREFYLNASCVDERPGKVDTSFVERLLAQCRSMAPGFRALLFAFDWARDETGAPMADRSTFHVPDDYVAGLAFSHPERFLWAASIHPYDPRALDRLDTAAALGARAIKWLPSAQNIDPADARCDHFYARLAALRMPLITHAGDERAVHGFGEHLGNPLRLRRPLDAGVRVVVAHCASLGSGHIDDLRSAKLSNFELFAQLMDDARYRSNLFGDISAITQGNRMSVVASLLERRDWHERLLNGSDYPLPGVVPLISLRALVDWQLLDAAAVDTLRRLRDINVLLYDFVLKRNLKKDGQGFATPVFETAPFFSRPA
ncbi:MAG: putative metal-dependent hydrolase of the TIM-barrel fold protein [Candidatus Accumulibacter adjunctus]|uniref:Metal-dependent hydrolase of the TIM-barrel fold protein n=1 Tax=Candidatus Accumulibacter adjunctus TaxID=1454001 RepID=A0A011MII7_9PROT|nr:MAG: putative metal-dependent hydrolase of the TIM-barrel fold protein [Candidatus Accumulibacter adjunctus]